MNDSPDVPTIRYYVPFAPDIGPSYLKALAATGLGVKACPIGVFFVGGEWQDLSEYFFAPMPSDKYINIVCAPPGMMMGTSFSADSAGGAGLPSLPGVPTLRRASSGPPPVAKEPVYKAQTAFRGLYTVGVPNVAVTAPRPKLPDEDEVRALQQYDFTITETEEDAVALRGVGVHAICVPPDPALLGRLLAPLL